MRRGHQRPDRPLLDAALAERRQHLLDVADERLVRPDDEHALARQLRVRRRAATRRGAGRRRSCPCPARPGSRARRATSRAISSYWSGVIVEMIWRISPTRWRVMSSTIASVRWSSSVARSGSSTNPSTVRSSMSSRRRRGRPCGSCVGRGVERLGRGRAPVDRQQLVVGAPDGVAADVQRSRPSRAIDAPEVQRPARLGVDADALAPHRLERLVGEVVRRSVASGRSARANAASYAAPVSSRCRCSSSSSPTPKIVGCYVE